MAKKPKRSGGKRKRRQTGASAQSGFAAGRVRADDDRDEEPGHHRILRGGRNRETLAEGPTRGELEVEVREGRVAGVRAADLVVEPKEGGEPVVCRLRKSTRVPHPEANAVAVGDWVRWIAEGEPPFVLTEVLPRRTRLARTRRGRDEQVIAANVDYAVVVTTAAEPPFKPRLVDRYLISVGGGGLEPVLVLNKIDLADLDEIEPMVAPYRRLGLPVFAVSAQTGEGIDALLGFLTGRTAVFSGQSGVGKSSLLNRLTGRELETQEVYGKLGKGRHTTSSSTLYDLPAGGAAIDTPGIRSFALHDPNLETLHAFFPEIVEASAACRFANCRHSGDGGCAVSEAVGKGKVEAGRLESYRILREEIGG